MAKVVFVTLISLAAMSIILFLIAGYYPEEWYQYLPDFNLWAKQFFIPEELNRLRSLNQPLREELDDVTRKLWSVRQQHSVSEKKMSTLINLSISDAYNSNATKSELLEQAVEEEKLLSKRDHTSRVSFKQLIMTGLMTFILFKSIFLFNIGW